MDKHDGWTVRNVGPRGNSVKDVFVAQCVGCGMLLASLRGDDFTSGNNALIHEHVCKMDTTKS